MTTVLLHRSALLHDLTKKPFNNSISKLIEKQMFEQTLYEFYIDSNNIFILFIEIYRNSIC